MLWGAYLNFDKFLCWNANLHVMILGGKIFWRWLGLDEVMRDKSFEELEPF